MPPNRGIACLCLLRKSGISYSLCSLHNLSITGIVTWCGTVSVIDTDKLNILQKIKIDVDKTLI